MTSGDRGPVGRGTGGGGAGPGPGESDRAEGMAVERTAAAWSRTGLAWMAAGLAVLKWSVTGATTSPAVITGVAILVGGLVVLGASAWRYRFMGRHLVRASSPAAGYGAMRAVGVATAVALVAVTTAEIWRL